MGFVVMDIFLNSDSSVYIVLVLKYAYGLVLNTPAKYVSYALGILMYVFIESTKSQKKNLLKYIICMYMYFCHNSMHVKTKHHMCYCHRSICSSSEAPQAADESPQRPKEVRTRREPLRVSRLGPLAVAQPLTLPRHSAPRFSPAPRQSPVGRPLTHRPTLSTRPPLGTTVLVCPSSLARPLALGRHSAPWPSPDPWYSPATRHHGSRLPLVTCTSLGTRPSVGPLAIA